MKTTFQPGDTVEIRNLPPWRGVIGTYVRKVYGKGHIVEVEGTFMGTRRIRVTKIVQYVSASR